MSAGKPVWSVVGDVCIDWLSIPVDPVASSEHEPNWRLCGGGHMFAVRGGAWLTADLLEALAGERVRVIKPVPREHLESVPPEDVLHSLVRLQAFPAAPGDKARVWRVARFEGYSGPLQGVPLPAAASEQPEAKAAVVVVDDAGNGFRRHAGSWPAALAPDARPLVLYKVRRPLMEGDLWKHLHAHHAGRTVAILNADDLRASGALISRCLSWERTAYDTWRALAQAPHLQPLRGCAWLVVTFGHEAALVARTREGQLDAARLWFVPQLAEGDLLRSGLGDMSGGGAAFTAGLAASLPAAAALDLDVMGEATRQGLVAARQMWAAGFGPPERVDARDKKKRSLSPPAFPSGPAAAGLVPPVPPPDFPLVSVPLPALRAGLSPADVERQRDWRILDMLRREPMEEMAFAALQRGVEKVFGSMPCGVFGKLVSLDRVEIEGLRTIRNLMLEYVRLARPERPLCLAVFGQPGSGKSFGVTQVALSVARSVRDAEIERIEFNVSQWDSPAHLVQALHRVRDITIRGKVPLVFFDEFDSTLGGAPLGWLKSFLAPMQDGVFSDGQFTYLIGRAILVFAGGTAHSFGAFSARADEPQLAGAKVSDFLSRLRGHVNVLGFGTPTGTNLVRRAVVLRVALQKKFPALFDAGGRLRIEPALARAFLTVDRYRHGARSIEAIVEMSRLLECGQYDASSLPPASQLDQHVDAEAFLAIVARPLALGEHLDRLARAIHERYLQGQLKRGARVGDRPALQPWEQLDAVFQNSNREQAAHIPLKLAAVHCELAPRGDRAGAAFEFSADELDQLARMEHARWMEERRLAQPQHPDLRPWEELPPDEQQKDRDAALAIPELVASVGLAIRRLD